MCGMTRMRWRPSGARKILAGALYDPKVAKGMRRAYEMDAAGAKLSRTHKERLALWAVRRGALLAITAQTEQTHHPEREE